MQSRSGELAMRPLPAVLLDLHEDLATGKLQLRPGRVAKTVDMVNGTPVSTASTPRDETLGHFLGSRGVLGEGVGQGVGKLGGERPFAGVRAGASISEIEKSHGDRVQARSAVDSLLLCDAIVTKTISVGLGARPERAPSINYEIIPPAAAD